MMSQLLLANGLRMVDLVSQDQEGNLGKLLHAQQCIQLGLALQQSLPVLRIDQEHDAGDFGEVVLPQPTRLLMAAEIEGGEFDVADGEFFRGGVKGRGQDGDSVVLEHVQEGGLSGVVETEEEQLGVFIGETEGGEDVKEPVEHPHVGGDVCSYFWREEDEDDKELWS